MTRYKQHLFICTNTGKDVCCGAKDSLDLAKALKQRCREAFGKEVRINKSGCLGGCEKGIVAALYPEGKFFEGLKPDDGDKLFLEIEKRMRGEKD